MIDWGRWLLRVLIVILVVLVERVVGIPMLSILLTSLFCSRLNKFWCYGLMLFSGLVIASLFMISLSKVMIILGLSFLWFKHGRGLVASQFVRLVIAGVLGAIAVVILSGALWQWKYLVHVLIVILVSFLGLKRHKFNL
ncbi:hypothetical protein KKE34_01545 [Patescibacteria group bacterium]|nr:hypothetical protein [Patescibacteria group bacterium]MBU1885273.1 hypothetical protein [Patescibacteria group bacterium]